MRTGVSEENTKKCGLCGEDYFLKHTCAQAGVCRHHEFSFTMINDHKIVPVCDKCALIGEFKGARSIYSKEDGSFHCSGTTIWAGFE